MGNVNDFTNTAFKKFKKEGLSKSHDFNFPANTEFVSIEHDEFLTSFCKMAMEAMHVYAEFKNEKWSKFLSTNIQKNEYEEGSKKNH